MSVRTQSVKDEQNGPVLTSESRPNPLAGAGRLEGVRSSEPEITTFQTHQQQEQVNSRRPGTSESAARPVNGFVGEDFDPFRQQDPELLISLQTGPPARTSSPGRGIGAEKTQQPRAESGTAGAI